MSQTQEDAAVKEAYQKQRDDFKKKRDELLKQIKDKLGEISDLEKVIAKARPKIPGADCLCPRCDTISMVYEGRTPQGGLSGGDDVYVCKICGRDNLNDTPWYKDSVTGIGYDVRAIDALKRR